MCLLQTLHAAGPLPCPAGAPVGAFRISVSRPGGDDALQLQSINELLPGYKLAYSPLAVDSPDKKRARIALVLVPSGHGKIVVLDPRPAAEAANWSVPVRTQVVGLVYGPQGLDKGKIGDLVKKNDEVVGQLADYAQKTQETQALIQAITQQQQALDTGQDVNAAVVSFANRFPGAPQLDPTQSANLQMLTLIRSVNPSLAAYDPLAQNPSQRAAQSANLAAAVAGLFFGTNVALAAGGGALLVNMHSLIFPGTEFRSAFAQSAPDRKDQTVLCGNKTPSTARTELAFLWATRIPDATAPEVSLPKPEHLPIGAKSSFPIAVKARDWSLAARVQDWKLVSTADEKISVPAAAKVNTQTKTIEIDPQDPKLKPGAWKLAGNWDWSPLSAGEIDLRPLSQFDKAHLTPDSQDRLTQGSGKIVVSLAGDDFEFVEKLAYRCKDDKFAQPSPLPFSLPKGPRAGPETTMETQIDPQSLAAGNYEFLIAQDDAKVHEVPFKVLPAPPQISNLPLVAHTDGNSERITLRGTGLDRIEDLSAGDARITLGEAKRGDEREAEVIVNPGIAKGSRITVQMKVKDFEQPIGLTDALLVAGPRPAITDVRASLPSDLGIELQAGEIPENSFVSFALDVSNAPVVTGVHLACDAGGPSVPVKLHPAPNGPLFLSFDPATVGQAGCRVLASLLTANSGDSLPVKLGIIVRLPKIESFQLTGDKAEGNAFYGALKGRYLEGIEKVGWDANTGTPVEAIPAPIAGGGSAQILRVAVPWPAPAPHAPLYIWLRGEQSGRATTARW
ncbi:MAG: hypothetical protein ABSB15_21160 [Bryobacteraceae bacterium]|jgi:hypothetical protein